MDKMINGPIEIRKKISLNINTNIFNLIKELAKLTKTNNTLAIEALMVKGVSPLLKQFRNSWTAILCDTKDKAKKEHMKKLLNDLEKLLQKKETRILMEA